MVSIGYYCDKDDCVTVSQPQVREEQVPSVEVRGLYSKLRITVLTPD